MSVRPRRMITATLWSTPLALGVAALFAGPYFGGGWRLPDRLERLFPMTQEATRLFTTVRWPAEEPLPDSDPGPADNLDLLVLFDEPDIYPRLTWAPWPEGRPAVEEQHLPTVRLWSDIWWSGWRQHANAGLPGINFPAAVTTTPLGSSGGGTRTIVEAEVPTGRSQLTAIPTTPAAANTPPSDVPAGDPPGPSSGAPAPSGPAVDATTPPPPTTLTVMPQETPQAWPPPIVPDLGRDTRLATVTAVGEPPPLLVFSALLPAVVWRRWRGFGKNPTKKLNH